MCLTHCVCVEVCLSHHLAICISEAQKAGVCMNILILFLAVVFEARPLNQPDLGGRCSERESLGRNVLLAQKRPPAPQPRLHAHVRAHRPLPRVDSRPANTGAGATPTGAHPALWSVPRTRPRAQRAAGLTWHSTLQQMLPSCFPLRNSVLLFSPVFIT